jgi:hypothetical protein
LLLRQRERQEATVLTWQSTDCRSAVLWGYPAATADDLTLRADRPTSSTAAPGPPAWYAFDADTAALAIRLLAIEAVLALLAFLRALLL